MSEGVATNVDMGGVIKKTLKRKRRPEAENLSSDWLLGEETVSENTRPNLCWALSRLCPTKLLELETVTSLDFQNLILRLGGFHLLMNYLGAIGTLMMSTGPVNIFTTAPESCSNTLQSFLEAENLD